MITDNTFWAYFAGLFTGPFICGMAVLFNYLVNRNKEFVEDGVIYQ